MSEQFVTNNVKDFTKQLEEQTGQKPVQTGIKEFKLDPSNFKHTGNSHLDYPGIIRKKLPEE